MFIEYDREGCSAVSEGSERSGGALSDTSDRVVEAERGEPPADNLDVRFSAEQEKTLEVHSAPDGGACEEARELETTGAVLELEYDVGFELSFELSGCRPRGGPQR